MKTTRTSAMVRGAMALLVVAAVGLGVQRPARAAGFLIYDLTGEALGKASAVTASTREPAAVWFNPAALTESQQGVSVGGVAVLASSRFEPAGGGAEIEAEPGRFLLPSVFATGKVHDQVAVAFGAFPAFGLSMSWPDGWIGREAAITASLQTFTLNPTVAVRVLPGLSFGLGFQAVRGAVEFLSGLPAVVGGTARLGGGTWGYGANAAVLYQPLPEQVGFGLSYRSRVKLDFDGRVDFDTAPDFASSLPDQGGTAVITLPDILSFGAMWRPVPTVALTFDTNYVFWSTYDELKIDFDSAPDKVMARNNHNSFTFRVGGDWQTPAEGLSVRGGLILDQNPSPTDTLSPSLPDATRLDVAAGLGYRWSWVKADLGYLFVYFLPSDSTGGREGPEGTYQSIAQLFGLTVSALFD